MGPPGTEVSLSTRVQPETRAGHGTGVNRDTRVSRAPGSRAAGRPRRPGRSRRDSGSPPGGTGGYEPGTGGYGSADTGGYSAGGTVGHRAGPVGGYPGADTGGYPGGGQTSAFSAGQPSGYQSEGSGRRAADAGTATGSGAYSQTPASSSPLSAPPAGRTGSHRRNPAPVTDPGFRPGTAPDGGVGWAPQPAREPETGRGRRARGRDAGRGARDSSRGGSPAAARHLPYRDRLLVTLPARTPGGARRARRARRSRAVLARAACLAQAASRVDRCGARARSARRGQAAGDRSAATRPPRAHPIRSTHPASSPRGTPQRCARRAWRAGPPPGPAWMAPAWMRGSRTTRCWPSATRPPMPPRPRPGRSWTTPSRPESGWPGPASLTRWRPVEPG